MEGSPADPRAVEGTVTAQLPSALYRVALEGGREVTANLGGDPRRNQARHREEHPERAEQDDAPDLPAGEIQHMRAISRSPPSIPLEGCSECPQAGEVALLDELE